MPAEIVRDPGKLGLPLNKPRNPEPPLAGAMVGYAQDRLGVVLDFGLPYPPHPWKAKRLAQRAERQAREAA